MHTVTNIQYYTIIRTCTTRYVHTLQWCTIELQYVHTLRVSLETSAFIRGDSARRACIAHCMGSIHWSDGRQRWQLNTRGEWAGGLVVDGRPFRSSKDTSILAHTDMLLLQSGRHRHRHAHTCAPPTHTCKHVQTHTHM